MRFVLDNSVVCGWYLNNQTTPYSDIIETLLTTGSRAIAPSLLSLELSNVLRGFCKRQRIIASQAQDILAQFSQLPIEIESRPSDSGLILSLALRYDLSSYDAAYLELALRLQLPIATQDVALAEAARASGVGVVSG